MYTLLPGLEENFRQIADSIHEAMGDRAPLVKAHIAGGVAVHYYTQSRFSHDIDIDWSHHVSILPENKVIDTLDLEGLPERISLDAGFGDYIGLFHPDWKQDADLVLEYRCLQVKIITPLDLAVSKIGRWEDRDRFDVDVLAAEHLFDSASLRSRAEEALGYFVGNTNIQKINLHEALEIVRRHERDSPSPTP